MRHVAFLMLVPLIAGCHVHSKNPADGDANVTINADESGQVNFNLPFASGSVKLPEGAMHNGDFDIDGVKMIPGGTISGFSVFAADKGSTVDIAFKSPRSAEETRAYFLEGFRQKGVQATAAGDAITGKSKDGDPFEMHIGPAARGSEGKITIHDND
jgi:hypothetical protein